MTSEYIVEGHRYNIFEDIGCYPSTFNSPPAYPLSIVWPVIIGLASATYCGAFLVLLAVCNTLSKPTVFTLRAFMKHREKFNEFLSSSSTSLSINRYFRLMALATLELLCTTPIAAYAIYLNITANPMEPWKGFADAHFDYSRIGQFPALIWRTDHTNVISLELSRWSLVFCAFAFFGFFGFAGEARKHYRLAFWTVTRRVGVSPSSWSTPSTV
jgi:pheromone a factor receptor